MEMVVNSPEVKKTVEDYDFTLSSGMMMPITVDTTMGDIIKVGSEVVQIHLVARPSLNDPTKHLPAEDITIFTKHLVSVQHRTREVVELTPEQQFEWTKTLKEKFTIQ